MRVSFMSFMYLDHQVAAPGSLLGCELCQSAKSTYSSWGEGRILVCAPSNNAADHILDRLLSAGTPPHYVTRVYSRFIERYHGSMYKGGILWLCLEHFLIQEKHKFHEVSGRANVSMQNDIYIVHIIKITYIYDHISTYVCLYVMQCNVT